MPFEPEWEKRKKIDPDIIDEKTGIGNTWKSAYHSMSCSPSYEKPKKKSV